MATCIPRVDGLSTDPQVGVSQFMIIYGLLRGPLCDLFECVIT